MNIDKFTQKSICLLYTSIPMDAENAWIWQVETNVNLKKAGIL